MDWVGRASWLVNMWRSRESGALGGHRSPRPLPHALPFSPLPSGCSWIIINWWSTKLNVLWVLWATLADELNPRRESRESLICSHLVRSTGDNLDFGLASEVGTVSWGGVLNLWDLVPAPGRQCQNWVKLSDTQVDSSLNLNVVGVRLLRLCELRVILEDIIIHWTIYGERYSQSLLLGTDYKGLNLLQCQFMFCPKYIPAPLKFIFLKWAPWYSISLPVNKAALKKSVLRNVFNRHFPFSVNRSHRVSFLSGTCISILPSNIYLSSSTNSKIS